jgi:hypothetical protein
MQAALWLGRRQNLHGPISTVVILVAMLAMFALTVLAWKFLGNCSVVSLVSS